MEGFKDCNGICKRKQHSKAALVNIEGAEDRMIELWEIVALYLPKDIYNMDKTGLFWKAILDIILAIKA